ncbi:MAG: thiamine phosphate synthase [Flavobacteriales bacterium]|nr:thiamine phosphate synthase [Flavobacteriales bacterium]
MISRLQYITQDHPSKPHSQLVREACEAGIGWVQLRMKNCSASEFLSEAKLSKTICDEFNSTLIINDNIQIAKEVKANGVHLGKNDINPTEARKILGRNVIIGGTANTFDDLATLVEQKVDYIGLGPYQETKTKENLSPILGVRGYIDIMSKAFEEYKNTSNNVNFPPIIAIGGIDLKDVASLMETEIHGLAISGSLTRDFSKTSQFIGLINQPVNTFEHVADRR